MTARHLERGHEVAVKFIIKAKVPEHCWWQDEILGRVPTEVLLMSLLNHKHIVKCLDLFEDDLYFYLVSSNTRARAVYSVTSHADLRTWLRYKNFMEHLGCPAASRDRESK